MRLSDFDYQLPQHLIAVEPLEARTQSRLMLVDRQKKDITLGQFSEIDQQFSENDVLVINNTRVIPARLHGAKSTGGSVECLVDKIISKHRCLAHLRMSKPLKVGEAFELAGKKVVIEDKADLYELYFPHANLYELLWAEGEMPIPPYLKRPSNKEDRTRYQTVYAETDGAIAAPTAGLHFDDKLLEKIRQKGTKIVTITLHVGYGTFEPIRSDDINDHQMHHENYQITCDTADTINQAKADGKRIVCVGTTSVRALESSAYEGQVTPFEGQTNLFITPGYRFQIVDGLITNFHLPKSSLLMLVSAFAGRELIFDAYKKAIEEQFRFFSYGDAMFIKGVK